MPNIYNDPNDPKNTVASKRAEVNAGALRYPLDNSSDSNYTIISFYEYTRGNPLSTPKEEKSQHIVLPLPASGLNDDNNIKFSQVELGALVGGTLAATGGGGAGGIGAALGLVTAQSIAKSAPTVLGDLTGNFIENKLPKSFGGVAQGIKDAGRNIGEKASIAAGMALGVALNPNMSLSFDGVELRDHQFSWRLVAKNQSESIAIRDIISKLKRMALPKKTAGGSFALSYPYICDIKFNPDIIKISRLKCFLTDIRVSYDGDGHPAFFKDTNAPVIVDLTLRFKERFILTSDDYALDNGGGY